MPTGDELEEREFDAGSFVGSIPNEWVKDSRPPTKATQTITALADNEERKSQERFIVRTVSGEVEEFEVLAFIVENERTVKTLLYLDCLLDCRAFGEFRSLGCTVNNSGEFADRVFLVQLDSQTQFRL